MFCRVGALLTAGSDSGLLLASLLRPSCSVDLVLSFGTVALGRYVVVMPWFLPWVVFVSAVLTGWDSALLSAI
jgi:hypothetical protein